MIGFIYNQEFATEAYLRQWQRMADATGTDFMAVFVVYTSSSSTTNGSFLPLSGYQAGDFKRNTTGALSVRALSRLAKRQPGYPGVKVLSYNIMMVGTASAVWRERPDWVNFDRTGQPIVDTQGMRLSLDISSSEAREYYRRNILATLADMETDGVYLDYGILAYGTPNWRAGRVANTADYVAFESAISQGLRSWAPRRGVLIANSPGNPLADNNFNELGSGVWSNTRSIAMSLQEGKIFTPVGGTPSHLYCYDKRNFLAFGAAVGSLPTYSPRTPAQFNDFVDTIAPFVRVALALRDAVPVPARVRTAVGADYNNITMNHHFEFIAMQTQWGGVVTAILTSRGPPMSPPGYWPRCPGTVSIDVGWLGAVSSGDIQLQQLAMRDPGTTCGNSTTAPLPSAFQALPNATVPVAISGTRLIWPVHCFRPGELSFATMLVIGSARNTTAADAFVRTATRQM